MTSHVLAEPDELRTIQVLVVEDEQVIAQDIKACLENLGYTVPAIAASGAEAVEQAKALCPDLVLMDIQLQGEMDGIQAAQQIWQELHIPVIYATEYSDHDTVERAMATDPFGYVLKPIKEQDLYVTLKTALRRYQSEAKATFTPLIPDATTQSTETLEYPDGPLPLSSRFYIERSPVEAQAYAEISKPGSLIRIKAPRKMGKSSLLLRISHKAAALNYSSIVINFHEVDAACFESLDKFLRWFCSRVAYQLKLKPQLDDVWDDVLGSKISCTSYFENYILEQLNHPLVLLLDEVNCIFKHEIVAQEFLSLLRIWYEKSKYIQIWQNLRLVILHSTEIHIPLNVKQSPFNVGLSLKLPEFTPEQIQELAQGYGLDWSNGQAIETLMQLVGGHPYLVHLALYHLAQQSLTLEQLLQDALTETGVYNSHLQSYWSFLQERPELLAALKQLVTLEEGCLDSPLIYPLDSMGLVKLEENRCRLSCELYRLYFKGKNLDRESFNIFGIGQLKEENQRLQGLVNTDALTQIANRRYFDTYLQKTWRQMLRDRAPLSFILCDIDYFKIYNDTWGHQTGDDCLFQVAQAIQRTLKRPGDLVARYGGEEFAIILPQTNATGAIQIAEDIRLAVKASALPFNTSKYIGLASPLVTISLGIATTIPNTDRSASDLILAADQALYESKQQGRDRTTLSSTLNSRV